MTDLTDHDWDVEQPPMITCRQALNRAIVAAEQAQQLVDQPVVRNDHVNAYTGLARAYAAIADMLAVLEQYEPADHEGNGHP